MVFRAEETYLDGWKVDSKVKKKYTKRVPYVSKRGLPGAPRFTGVRGGDEG